MSDAGAIALRHGTGRPLPTLRARPAVPGLPHGGAALRRPAGSISRRRTAATARWRIIVLVVGFVVVIAALLVEVSYGWPVWLHLLVWLPLSVVLCLAMMRPLKATLIALQYKHRRHEFDAG